MRIVKWIVALLVGLVGLTAVVVYLNFGTIDPCGVMRERMRRQAAAEGGTVGGFVASVLPDSVINASIAAQYNKPVTPGLCIGILLGTERAPEILPAGKARR